MPIGYMQRKKWGSFEVATTRSGFKNECWLLVTEKHGNWWIDVATSNQIKPNLSARIKITHSGRIKS